LIFTNTGESNRTPGFYESETGQLRFKIDTPQMDAIRFVTRDQHDPDRYVYAIAGADTRHTYRSPPKRNQGFLLLKIDCAKGRVLWWKKCYEGTNPGNPLRPADPLQVDLNGDRVTDLIVGNSKNGRLTVEAIDGRDGQTLWELPLHLDIKDWPWREPWPMMTLIQSGSQSHLLLIDGVDADEEGFELKSIQLRDGKELDAIRRLAGRFSLSHAVQSRQLSLNVISPEKRDGLVALATEYPYDNSLISTPGQQRTGKPFGLKWLQVDEYTGVMKELDVVDASETLFTADVNDDPSLERIEFVHPNQIRVHSGEADKIISEFEIPANSGIHRVEQLADQSYFVATVDNKEHLWFELPSGRVALEFGQGLKSTRNGETSYPRLLAHSTGTLLVGSTPESVLCAQVDLGEPSTNSTLPSSFPVAMISADVDPRYRRAIVVHGLYDRKSLADVIRLALLTLGAILIPVGYVYRLTRRRQWSLQSMLMAPAICMLALVCWRALWSSQAGYLVPDIIAGVMAALSVWAMFTLMRHQSWKLLGVSIALSMLLATLLMFGAQATFPLRSPGMIGYWTLSAWFTSVCAAAAQIVMPMAVGVAWGQARIKKAGSAP
jgi:hypothetical protein